MHCDSAQFMSQNATICSMLKNGSTGERVFATQEGG
jgi:hypothetical protein